ncbi:MAG: hypothetical protein NTZ90_08350 [Proteobacteria bacterium]|nr:hypothetical protein [Pseudomonadota bacterium]
MQMDLDGGDNLDQVLDDFHTVSKELVVQVLELLSDLIFGAEMERVVVA